MHPLRPAGGLQEAHVVDAERADGGAAHLRVGRLRAGRRKDARCVRSSRSGCGNMGSRSGALIILAVAASAVAAPDRFVTATLSPRSARPGDLVVVTIDAPGETNANPKVFVKAFGRAVPSFATANHQWQALIGVDLDVKPGTYKVDAVVEDIGGEHDLVVVPRTFPTRRLTVDPDFVTPPPSEEKRIEAEAKLLERTWASTTAERLWTG